MNTPNINLLRDEVLKLQHFPDESFERPDMVHFMRAIISEHDQLVTSLQRELADIRTLVGPGEPLLEAVRRRLSPEPLRYNDSDTQPPTHS